VDAAQRGQLGAGFDALPQLDFAHHGLGRTRQNWGWGTQAEINIIRGIRLAVKDSLSRERAQSLFGGNAARVFPTCSLRFLRVGDGGHARYADGLSCACDRA
jgi:hypothetical protein